MNPLDATEFPDLVPVGTRFDAKYRTTFKVRVLSDTTLPAITSFEAYTDSEWEDLDVEIEWGGGARGKEIWDGKLEVFNGLVEHVEPLSTASKVRMMPGGGWRSRVRAGADGIAARIRYAKPKAHNSFDTTVVTVRAVQETFSFAPLDLLRWEYIFIPDLGAIVRVRGNTMTYAAASMARQNLKSEEVDIYSRVFDREEQTLTNAWANMPVKQPQYIPLSFEGGRQHFKLDEYGKVHANKSWISRLRGRDTDHCLWEGDTIEYDLGLPPSRRKKGYLVDGYLPMMVSIWEEAGVRYRQEAFVIPLAGIPDGASGVLADDPLVLSMRMEMTRLSNTGEVEASLDFNVRQGGRSERLILEEDRILGQGNGTPPRLRMRVASSDPPESYRLQGDNGQVSYWARLDDDAPIRTVDVSIPYITLSLRNDIHRLGSLEYDEAFSAVRRYWTSRIAAGTQIHTPEPMVNDFYRAHAGHMLINSEREVGNRDHYMPKVGTFMYGVYGNESAMMISDLDRRGYTTHAEHALKVFLHYQGTVGLPGDFSSKRGVFYGAGGYEQDGYNQHHGWVLWCLGEHYWYTRDARWLVGAAPNIVEGCNWIIRERNRTSEEAKRNPIRAIERGLLPPGRLEDIGDWRSWLSSNVYTWWGMRNAASALDAIGHRDGRRFLAEAAAYGEDILAAYSEAMQRSPVVRLRDGSWIPHIPADVHRRGRSFGWITETLEGAIHLLRSGLIGPRDRRAGWIIRDYEDNLYLSEQYGYNLVSDEFERYWFSRGGISMQANLLCNPIPYLLRDETKHFLRAYFNAFAVSYFSDTRMMTEHALPYLGNWAGDHYKTSDESNSTYWLRLMFLAERNDELWIGAAIPRYWLSDGREVGIENAVTYFGRTSVRMTSRVASGSIEMTIDPPTRNRPKRILARFRHPEGRRIVRCEVNGKPYRRFDPDKERVVLAEWTVPTKIVAYYD